MADWGGMADPQTEAAHGLISAAQVEGTPVFDLDGERLGHVEDVLLHKLSGRVAYAVLATGGFLGLGEKLHPLPWNILKYDLEREGYVVPVGKAQLKAAPAYDKPELDAGDAGWSEAVHHHFQVSPAWV